MSEAAADSASDFAASSDEEGSQQGWTPRQAFVICDAFPTFEEAIIGIDVLDGCHYKYKHNYGNAGLSTLRAPSWKSGQKSHFSTATRILCENIREKIKLLKVPAFYEDNVLPDIRYLSKARSEKQFKALSNVFLAFWKENSEDDYAAWFRDIYLGDTWGN
ncbi:hypothetical protein PI124_g19209 [Phytophthora idaei]|nr:hypothetical protein PI124_g19209 [Phytophthora idaei]